MGIGEHDLRELTAFLQTMGKRDLYEYFSLNARSSLEDVEERLTTHRQWAQGQQANPRYQEEALWIIRQQALLKRLLLEAPEDYRSYLDQQQESIEEVPEDEEFVDYYALLGIGPQADFESLSTAHRERYREARNLKRRTESEEIYQKLDEAWRVLRHADRRARYNVSYRERFGLDEDWREGGPEREAMGLLGPPPEAQPLGFPEPPPLPDPPEDAEPETETAPPNLLRKMAAEPRRRMLLQGARERTLKAWKKPVSFKVHLERRGSASLRVQVQSNRDWLQPRQDRLLLDREVNHVEVVIHPALLAENDSARLTFVAGNQEKESLVIHLKRRAVSPLRLGLVALGAALVWMISLAQGWVPETLVAPAPPPSMPELTLRVNPRADVVTVNGLPAGAGQEIALSEGLPTDEEFILTAVLDGFAPQTHKLRLRPGEVRQLDLRLELTDSMDFQPDEANYAGDRHPEVEQATHLAIDGVQAELEQCVLSESATAPEFEIYLAPTGHIIGASSSDPVAQAALPCIKRILRTLRTPLFGGRYATVRRSIHAVPTVNLP